MGTWLSTFSTTKHTNSIMISKLGKQIIIHKFSSYWVPHSSCLLPNKNKLSKITKFINYNKPQTNIKNYVNQIIHLLCIINHHLDTDLELGACLFYMRRQELGEYSADGGDQAGFGVVGGHVGWWCSRRMTKRSSPAGSVRGGGRGQWEKGTKS